MRCRTWGPIPAGDRMWDRLWPERTVPDSTCNATLSGRAKRTASFWSGLRAGAAGTSLATVRPPTANAPLASPPGFPHPKKPTLSRKRMGRRVRSWSMGGSRQFVTGPFRNGGVGQKFFRGSVLTLVATCGRAHLWAMWVMTQLLPQSACSCSVQSSGKKINVWKRGGRYCCQLVPPVAAMSTGSLCRCRTALR